MNGEKMDLQEQPNPAVFDIQFALQCAPLILGLRISLFLTVTDCQLKRMEDILKDRKISIYKISKNHGKMAVLLFYEKKMKEYFAEDSVCSLLDGLGYSAGNLSDNMNIFAKKYREFMQNKKPFPHEMGIFLGYPPEDVKGYLENKGNNFLCAGYWKVYENAQEKCRLFSQFDWARNVLVSLILQGNSLGEAVKLVTV